MLIKHFVYAWEASMEVDGRASFGRSSLGKFPSLWYRSSELLRWGKWMGYDGGVIVERKIKFYWDSLNQITNYV